MRGVAPWPQRTAGARAGTGEARPEHGRPTVVCQYDPMPLGQTGRYPLLAGLLVVVLAAGCAESRDVGGAWEPAPGATPGSPGTPSAPTAGPTTAPAEPTPARGPARFAFPVQGNASYQPVHSYPATDIFADCGAPVLAMVDGTVHEVSRVDNFDPDEPRGPNNGGKFVSILGDDGVRYYGSHLTEVARGVEPGARVEAGRQIGTVGRTGNANDVCHLHFGISPVCAGKDGWWIRRGVVWPAPYLDSWRDGGQKSAAREVAAWHRKNGCPKAP
ncbi:M23 family metallopeptidase [Micromonosporaceae bacterium DT55]|uniref:M23 family metallopeptidase n=2 Tax=Melissospora conviva TaxID=3388432 RepID=UPI003C1F1404